jgi:hypothetical protein
MFGLALLFGAAGICCVSAALVTQSAALAVLAVCLVACFLYCNMSWVSSQKEREWK